jgi:hypothetical protein
MYTVIETGIQYPVLSEMILEFETEQNHIFAWYDGVVEIDEDDQHVITTFTQEQVNVAYEYIRKFMFAQTSDPLFFKYQVGEITKEDWESARDSVKADWITPTIETTD